MIKTEKLRLERMYDRARRWPPYKTGRREHALTRAFFTAVVPRVVEVHETHALLTCTIATRDVPGLARAAEPNTGTWLVKAGVTDGWHGVVLAPSDGRTWNLPGSTSVEDGPVLGDCAADARRFARNLAAWTRFCVAQRPGAASRLEDRVRCNGLLGSLWSSTTASVTTPPAGPAAASSGPSIASEASLCDACDSPLGPGRSDRRFCGPRCRQKHYRERRM